MTPQRKRGYFLLAGLTVILFIFHLQGREVYSTLPRYQNTYAEAGSKFEKELAQENTVNEAAIERPGTSQSSLNDERRKPWDQLKENYPIQNFLRIPAGKPAQLPRIQHSFVVETEEVKKIRLQRRGAVKKVFERCWSSYRKNAWLRDEIMPISGQANDWFGGWAATLIDSLDTLWIMNMKQEFEEAAHAAAQVDFSPGTTSLESINVFETNIRHLGGLLGAYDLSGDKRLLEKATEVGNMLYAAFDTPNRMPITRWRPAEAAKGIAQSADEAVLSAELGSFSLEFTRLTQLTGDPRFYDAAKRITNGLHQAQSKTRLPGMFHLVFNARDMMFSDGGSFKLGAMIDSMYEYFPKTYALLGGMSGTLRELYDSAAHTAIKHILFKPYTPDNADILIAGSLFVDEHGKFYPRISGEHLGCYAGGMFALGGMLTGNQRHLEAGRKLTDGCIWTYRNSPFGMMPESFTMDPCPKSSACTWDEERWKEAVRRENDLIVQGKELDEEIKKMHLPQGFTSIPDKRYILRPEAIESVFVLYRITGDTKYVDAAWDMFLAIEKHTKTDKGNAALEDVISAKEPPKQDRMESFWMAETLKYFYLIFSEPSLISLDEYVLNTEAHPFKRPA